MNNIPYPNLFLFYFQEFVHECSGPNKNECTANAKNKHPPIVATAFSDILAASILPPTTATPVQKAWPARPPNTTPKGFLEAARAIVAI